MQHFSLLSSRREWLKRAGAAVALLAGGTPSILRATPATSDRKRSLRIAHITDVHVEPERKAGEGLAACLHHIQDHTRPDLILGTGDAIMDSMKSEESRVKAQWDVWRSVWKSECSLPVEHAIGNHDVWGIYRDKSKTTGKEPLFGKKWVMSINGWDKPYRSFDRAGWHFIALDGVTPKDDGYIGQLDEEQFAWLADDLARVDANRPVLVFSHIPLFSAAAFMGGAAEQSGNWQVSAATMHIDFRRIKDLFKKHTNVKLCLSGHLHLVDRVDYLGVSYLCNGAVCSGWWRQDHQECKPGYGVIDLYSDGTFENDYVPYGWKYAEA